ncbi:adenylate/guanylate cyclase domain-containing protein [Mycolicibacterium sp. D5.8-2]|uniref:adenylate/guanylate cyclase domain-containing protein n=1 Tax=Mycolicibacterium sp. D5.8-2 TaxID=3085903 RepID=UPI00298CBFEE|nr:adenylate/guanylate cyclase domain-containing protein [Mycolicibacterium sp. D5.8-2]MDW5612074.1 adenylate/guanylate cyclase domain-containing protein [Mycolicibacterium sp. D5.8-2]
MGFKDDCTRAVRDIVKVDFNTRWGREVPTTDSIVQKDGAVWLTAAYLYADMADSTGMAENFESADAAKIIRAYLSAVTRVLKDRGGEIRSFDGDRVMAIFPGDDAADKAVDAGLRVNWVVDNIVHDELLSNNSYYQKYVETGWRVRHRTGVDLGTAFIVRAGVRGDNDLVSVGSTPNVAAKLSDYKGRGPTAITDYVYENLSYGNQYAKDSQSGDDEIKSMWSAANFVDIGGTWESVRTSTWWRSYT